MGGEDGGVGAFALANIIAVGEERSVVAEKIIELLLFETFMTQPTERVINYVNISGEGNIAVDYDLAKVNHRLYRQSKCYYGTVRMQQVNPGDELEIYTLANTWFNKKAYMLAMEMYFNSRKEELEHAGAGSARWDDFRVAPGQTSYLLGNPLSYYAPTDPSLHDTTYASSQFGAGEYFYSRIWDSAGDPRGFTWGEANTTVLTPPHYTYLNAYNVVTEYNKRANVQDSPENVAVDIPYADSERQSSEGLSEAEMDDVVGAGNEPPYNPNAFPPGFAWIQRGVLGSDTNGANSQTNRLSTGLIPIPNGIILFKAAGTVNIQVELKAGNYKGVHVEDWGTPKLMNDKTWKVL